jgi:hypothetical protein
MMIRLVPVVLVAIGLSLGCGGPASRLPTDAPPLYPAKGKVTYNGSPLGGALVVFYPESGNISGSAQTGTDGTFSVQAYPPHEGMPVGNYKVTVKKTESIPLDTGDPDTTATETKYLTPERYGQMNASGLTAEVPEGGRTDLVFELTD